LQVSWVKLGFEASLACLQAGANDFSGTLMEESISKAAGATFGEYVAPEEFRARIRSIGRVPAERTTTYKIRRLFEDPEDDPRSSPTPLPMVRTESHVAYTEGSLLSDFHASTPPTRQGLAQRKKAFDRRADA